MFQAFTTTRESTSLQVFHIAQWKTIDKSAAEQMPTRVAGKTKENETLMMLVVVFPLFSLLSSAIIHVVHALDAWPWPSLCKVPNWLATHLQCSFEPLQGMLISREAWKALLCLLLLLLEFGMFISFYVISSWRIKKSLTFIIFHLELRSLFNQNTWDLRAYQVFVSLASVFIGPATLSK